MYSYDGHGIAGHETEVSWIVRKWNDGGTEADTINQQSVSIQ